jgi:hypothetical protein
VWNGGVWNNGKWRNGVWNDGTWHNGVWNGGVWNGGEWRGAEDRILFMAARLGIVFDSDGRATAYRSVRHDMTGKYSRKFVQELGEQTYDHAPAGSGTCCRGIHVSSADRAYTFYGVDPSSKLIRVTFRRDQLLDCDGEKARISGGFFEEIPWPFLPAQAAMKHQSASDPSLPELASGEVAAQAEKVTAAQLIQDLWPKKCEFFDVRPDGHLVLPQITCWTIQDVACSAWGRRLAAHIVHSWFTRRAHRAKLLAARINKGVRAIENKLASSSCAVVEARRKDLMHRATAVEIAELRYLRFAAAWASWGGI